MKSATPEMAAHLQGECLTLATIWKITRTDGEVLGFTDHDQDITISFGNPATTITYAAALGYTRSALKGSVDLSVDNLEVMGIIDAAGMAENDLRAGKYDHATIEIGVVNWADLTMGSVYMRRGRFGEVNIQDDSYYVELRGLTQFLTREVGSVYTPDCTANLGDEDCTIDLSGSTQDGTDITQTPATVSFVTDQETFKCTGITGATDFFSDGIVEWISAGDNSGRRMEISNHVNNGVDHTIDLMLPMPFQVSVGHTFTIIAGCDKTVAHCKLKFGPNDGLGNIYNYRGFPHVPVAGTTILGYPDGIFGGFVGQNP